MSEEPLSQRSWARSERELAEAPLPELVPSGPIVGGSPLRLCYLAAARSATGRLTLEEASGARHEIDLRRGTPVAARTNVASLGLIAWLAASGRLDDAGRRRAEAAGGDPLEALFRLGLLAPATAWEHLAAHGRAVLERALAAEDGTFRWEPDAAAPPGAFPLGDPWALLCACGRRIPPETVARRLGARIDCPVMRAGDGLVPVERLGLNAHETRVVAALDGTRSLAMLAAAAPAEAATIYRTGLFLAELGLASFARATLPRPPGAPLPGAPEPVAPGARTRAAAPGVGDAAASRAPGAAAGAGTTAGPRGLNAAGVGTTAGPRGSNAAGVGTTAGPRGSNAAGVGTTAGPRGSGAPGGGHTAGPRGSSASGVGHSAGPRGSSTPGVGHTAGPRGASGRPGIGHTAGPRATGTPGPRPAAPRRGTPGPGGAGHALRVPTDAAGLRRHLDELTTKNHFEVLGLPRTATPEEIKVAYFQRARAFHPDLAGVGDTEVRQLREAITARLNEAWHCLSDDARRREYLAELQNGAGRKVDVANVLAAEQLFQQAVVLARLRRFQEALAEVEKAIGINPDEGEFHAWRGWLRFASAQEKTSARAAAVADLEKAIAKNPRCAPAWLFAARIESQTGDAATAIQYYRRCLSIDEANVEAQRELRLLESRFAK